MLYFCVTTTWYLLGMHMVTYYKHGSFWVCTWRLQGALLCPYVVHTLYLALNLYRDGTYTICFVK